MLFLFISLSEIVFALMMLKKEHNSEKIDMHLEIYFWWNFKFLSVVHTGELPVTSIDTLN